MEDSRKYLPPHGWQVGEKIWIDEDAATNLIQGQLLQLQITHGKFMKKRDHGT
jgi:hypothetical protein